MKGSQSAPGERETLKNVVLLLRAGRPGGRNKHPSPSNNAPDEPLQASEPAAEGKGAGARRRDEIFKKEKEILGAKRRFLIVLAEGFSLEKYRFVGGRVLTETLEARISSMKGLCAVFLEKKSLGDGGVQESTALSREGGGVIIAQPEVKKAMESPNFVEGKPSEGERDQEEAS